LPAATKRGARTIREEDTAYGGCLPLVIRTRAGGGMERCTYDLIRQLDRHSTSYVSEKLKADTDKEGDKVVRLILNYYLVELDYQRNQVNNRKDYS
jgi:hypothetical protein